MSTLYIVATPLGNLEDLSPRAVRVLRECDLIACEDTRRTGRLLAHVGVETPMVSHHEHNEEQSAKLLLRALDEGKQVALVSDAGTPLISDPGYHLVRRCRSAGVPVVPVPGPCAAVAALSASGLPTDRFLFAGFPARKASALRVQLEGLVRLDCTLVFYLSPHRLGPTLSEFARLFGDRKACLFREMTKVYETSSFGTLAELAERAAEESPRGEYTLVVEGARDTSARIGDTLDVAAYVSGLETLRNLPRRDALKRASRDLGRSRREVYDALIDREKEA